MTAPYVRAPHALLTYSFAPSYRISPHTPLVLMKLLAPPVTQGGKRIRVLPSQDPEERAGDFFRAFQLSQYTATESPM